MIYGLLHLSFWGNVLAAFILTQLTIASVTLYLHRCQAHRALTLHPLISHPIRFWLWLSTGMNTKEWTAIHRKHHAKCETAEDPHSPQILGIRKVLWQGTELYRKESINQETLERYGQGTPDDWIERRLYLRRPYLGIGLMFLIDAILFGIPGISIWAIQMMWIPFFAAGVINGIGHFWGYRNYECPDAARNIVPWGVFIGGEELHNNHHAFGSAANFSSKWWEIDIGWYYIKILSLFGLATVKKTAPKLTISAEKHCIDADTLKAVIVNRFHIMANYSKEVILPVLKREKRFASGKSKAIFQYARTLLVREQKLLDQWSKQRLLQLLEKYQRLKLVYHYREQLQAIWNKTSASQKELLEALQQWCERAENSGIVALKQFSQRLKAYGVFN